jgi:nitrogen fixation NifU-like protein
MDMSELYQELILDHNKRPRNRRIMESPDRTAEGFNPLCGDRVTVYVHMDDAGRVSEITFEGSGCAISTASASLMTEAVKGMKREQIEALAARFHDEVTGVPAPGGANGNIKLGKLEALAGVKKYPARVKCATLAWHTLKAALADRQEIVSTE